MTRYNRTDPAWLETARQDVPGLHGGIGMNASRYHDATPHPDRLIEASRPRPEPEDDSRGHVMLGWLMLSLCIIGAMLIFWTIWIATVSRVETELLVTPETAIALMERR